MSWDEFGWTFVVIRICTWRWFKLQGFLVIVVFHKLEELVDVTYGAQLGLQRVDFRHLVVVGLSLICRHNSKNVIGGQVLFQATRRIRHAQVNEIGQINTWKSQKFGNIKECSRVGITQNLPIYGMHGILSKFICSLSLDQLSLSENNSTYFSIVCLSFFGITAHVWFSLLELYAHSWLEMR